MKQITTIRKKVTTMANHFHKMGLTLSQAFIKAWAMIKAGTLKTKVKGVTYGIGQALARLATYPVEDIIINLKRDHANLYDPNAIEVYAGVKDKGVVTIGYLPAPLACIVSP